MPASLPLVAGQQGTFTSGACEGQTFTVTDLDTDTGAVTLSGLSASPSAGDTFSVSQVATTGTVGTPAIGEYPATGIYAAIGSLGTTIGGLFTALWTAISAALAAILSRVSTTPIQATVLVQPGGAIAIEQYCSYKAERGNALSIAVAVPVNLTGADVHLWIAPQTNGTPVMPPKIDVPSCTVVGPRTAATGLSADISSAQTGTLTQYNPNAYAWCFVAYYAASGDQVPITAWSDCTVTPGVALTS